jgi:endonuclease/exonuclease/phosphatase family metal-dependent hydrolase
MLETLVVAIFVAHLEKLVMSQITRAVDQVSSAVMTSARQKEPSVVMAGDFAPMGIVVTMAKNVA